MLKTTSVKMTVGTTCEGRMNCSHTTADVPSDTCGIKSTQVGVPTGVVKIAIDTEATSTDPHTARLLGTSVQVGDNPPSYTSGLPSVEMVHADTFFIAQNGIYDAILLRKHGFPAFPISFDTMLAQYVLWGNKYPMKLEAMVKQYFNRSKPDLVEVYNKATGKDRVNIPEKWYEEIPEQMLVDYALDDVHSTMELYKVLESKLKEKPELYKWYYEVEIPMLNILIETTLAGVQLDTDGLRSLGVTLTREVAALEERLRFLADNPELNLNSPKQLREVLYDKFQLPVVGKTATKEPSTDIGTLTKLAEKHAFPKLLLRHRTCQKINSTYVDGLLGECDQNGRIHTQYNQCLTRTRRFSSENPNLQNIPSKGDLGMMVKEKFIAPKGKVLATFDYNQMELRILASASGDAVLLDAFRNDADIHQITADALRIPRSPDAKIVNFSIVYGTTEFGLSEQLGISVQEAKDLIKKWLDKYEGVKTYMSKQKALVCKTNGWVYSYPAGLPIFCGEFLGADRWEEDSINRRAINAPIQGGSQDILKKAIINIKKETGYAFTLMVHDELVYELPEKGHEKVVETIIQLMQSAWKLSVPLVVSSKVSTKWEK